MQVYSAVESLYGGGRIMAESTGHPSGDAGELELREGYPGALHVFSNNYPRGVGILAAETMESFASTKVISISPFRSKKRLWVM